MSRNIAPARRWISPRETAEYLDCHLQTVYAWIDSGKLPAVRIGRSVRVDLRALEAEFERQVSEHSTFKRSRP